MDKVMRLRQRPAADREVRGVVILGATGSIGKSTAEIIAGAGGAFRVEAVAGGRASASLGPARPGTRRKIRRTRRPFRLCPIKGSLGRHRD